MQPEPPPSYESALFNHGIHRSNYSGRSSPSQMSVILQPTVPPGGIELPVSNHNDVMDYLKNVEGGKVFIVPMNNQQHQPDNLSSGMTPSVTPRSSHPPEFLRNNCQTPNGGRYVVNRWGVVEHLTESEYENRIAYQCVCSIIGVGIAVVVIIICACSGVFKKKY